jgi:signal transduction histidine kinase
MPLLIGLLVVTFAIAADLAHEAWSTALAQQVIAERAGRDVVRFTATSAAYEARAAVDLALHTLFAPVAGAGAGTAPRRDATPDVDALVRSAARVRRCACAPVVAARYYFRIRSTDGDLQVAGQPPRPAERQWLRDTILARLRSVRQPELADALIYHSMEGERLVIGYTVRQIEADSVTYVYGFVIAAGAFGDAVFVSVVRPARQRADLTAHTAGYDSLMRTSVSAPDGSAIYSANPRQQPLRVTMVPRAGHEVYVPGVAPVIAVPLFADTVSLGDRYGDLRLHVWLDVAEPGALDAGGVPRSRLFALFGLLVLMGGLVVAAVLQLRREHELARLRADLTAGVSHELRTPLAQILLFGETLMLERTRSERERRAAAEVIVRETRRLMHLVENALHFTRADRHLLDRSEEVVDLAPLTREILVSFAPLAWTARVTLREVIDDPAPALIDSAAYRQIVLNLLENAVRYGPAGQTVTVRLERHRTATRLLVDDEGPGVPAAERERVWAPFVRLTSNRRRAPGTGIGLAVVRDLTLRHGGRAWVEQAEEGGARFVIELPSSAAPLVKDSGREGEPPAARVAL